MDGNMNNRHRNGRLRDTYNRLDRIHETDLSKISWVYLRHPSGRVHRINAGDRDVIATLIKQGWEKVSDKIYRS